MGCSTPSVSSQGLLAKGLLICLLMRSGFNDVKMKQITEKPKHAGEGILYGGKDFAFGIVEGLTGVVTQPVKGAKKEGALGFFKGIGKGIVVIGVKPVVGAADFVAKTSEGIRNTTTMNEKETKRSRPPRMMGSDGNLTEYTEKESKGLFLLNHVEQGDYRTDTYIHHEELQGNKVLLITDTRVILCDQSNYHEDWAVKFQNITEVEVKGSGVLIKLNKEPGSILVSCPDEAKRMVIYLKLGACTKSHHANKEKTTSPAAVTLKPSDEKKTSPGAISLKPKGNQ